MKAPEEPKRENAMFSKYRVMAKKLSELRPLYPQTLNLRRAVECREYARTMRNEAGQMTGNVQGRADRERVAEMYEEKVEFLVNEHRKSHAGR
jgi:hypothetical protein